MNFMVYLLRVIGLGATFLAHARERSVLYPYSVIFNYNTTSHASFLLLTPHFPPPRSSLTVAFKADTSCATDTKLLWPWAPRELVLQDYAARIWPENLPAASALRRFEPHARAM